MARPPKTPRWVESKTVYLIKNEGRKPSQARAMAWAMYRRKEEDMAARRTRRKTATKARRRVVRRKAPRRNARKYGPSTRRGQMRKTSRRAYVRKNPRALWQTPAFQSGIAAVAGGIAAFSLQNVADNAEEGSLMSFLSPTIGGFRVPAGVMGSALTLFLIAPMMKGKNKNFAVAAAAGMLAPVAQDAIGQALNNPRSSSYKRVAAPRRPAAITPPAARPGSMVSTAQLYKLSTVPA
jgi:hypothetical protein